MTTIETTLSRPVTVGAVLRSLPATLMLVLNIWLFAAALGWAVPSVFGGSVIAYAIIDPLVLIPALWASWFLTRVSVRAEVDLAP